MSRDELLHIADIKESREKVLKSSAGMDLKDFVHDELHYDEVFRYLEIIREAFKHIS